MKSFIKKALHKVPVLLGGVLFLWACNTGNDRTNEQQTFAHQLAGNWPYAVTYEIFVQSFYDTNEDGIGDINGVTEKLDYLKDLGIEALWLMPISPSPSYHKYDVTDYKDIHPDYGTKADFKRLVQAAHDRNIKIVIDLVINHTGRDHPWFVEAVGHPDGPYRDYYVWANKDSIAENISKKEIALDSDNLTQWHPADSTDDYYYGFFWGGMPDLNYDNPLVRDEIFDIGRFWLEEMGVDGFRLDAAKHIYPDDRPTDNHRWWITFREEMQKIKPGVFLLGEVWSEAEVVAPYLEGLPALFNFDVGKGIIEAVKSENSGGLLQKHQQIQQFYQKVNPEYIDAIFITNHDQNRIASEVAGDQNKARMAAALVLTLPGSPFIYYGEELGMLGVKPDEHIREPFNWAEDGSDKGETSWLEPKYTTDRSVTPLAAQLKDSLSMYNHYRAFIQLRNDHPALTYGTLIPDEKAPPEISSFLRVHELDTLWVLHNLSNRKQQTGGDFTQINEALFHNGLYSLDSQNVSLAPYSTLILKN